MKIRRIVSLLLAVLMLLGGVSAVAEDNNGRPYNDGLVKYDTRADKYLNGANLTKLPLVDEPTTIKVWQGFSSTIMQGADECLVFQELEKRTGVTVEFLYPPVGSETDNYNMRIASGDLPHIFTTPPGYPGGDIAAVEDEVYVDLTPYYEKGLMPNLKYLVDNNPDIAKDLFNDEGQLLFFPQIDIVPTAPWSGLWIRQDWLDELNMEIPTTIEEWDAVLYAMKELKGTAPLGINFPLWYGVETNYMFAASYECSFRTFMNKDGKVVYGSIEPGYRDFLTLMAKWYADGIIDPDFVTRTFEDFNGRVADGTFGACGLSYAEYGQQQVTGLTIDPDWNLVPVAMPTSYEGQVIHIHQNDPRVRAGYKEYMTVAAVDDGVDELVVQWMDYRYSQDGGDLCSYGVEGVSYEWKEDGEINWIHPALTENPDADFWTLYPLWKFHNAAYMRDSSSYTFEPAVLQSIEVWASQDDSWLMPQGMSTNAAEAAELADIMTDVNTYVEEMTYAFITGQASLNQYDAYVEQVKALGIERATEIYQTALERYLAR